MARLFWITGLAGSGKTCAAEALYRLLKADRPNVVLLDGDQLRSVLGATSSGYRPDDRRKLAMTYARLCKLLVEQEIDVICATVSMFEDVRRWMRLHVAGYTEIYLKVPMETLVERNKKGLYRAALSGERQHVVGVDMPYEEPTSADLVLDFQESPSPADYAQRIYDRFVRAGQPTG